MERDTKCIVFHVSCLVYRYSHWQYSIVKVFARYKTFSHLSPYQILASSPFHLRLMAPEKPYSFISFPFVAPTVPRPTFLADCEEGTHSVLPCSRSSVGQSRRSFCRITSTVTINSHYLSRPSRELNIETERGCASSAHFAISGISSDPSGSLSTQIRSAEIVQKIVVKTRYEVVRDFRSNKRSRNRAFNRTCFDGRGSIV